MLGETTKAIRVFDGGEPTILPESPAWLIQAWRLYRADILQLCGNRSAALAQAREAIALSNPVLHTPSFAGAFSRWLGMIAEEERDFHVAKNFLDGLSTKMSELDALDRVEVTCARLLVTDGNASESREALLRYLAALPPAIAIQLRCLGVLRS
jgi:hypothetical protein